MLSRQLTDRVHLRLPESSDGAELYALIDANRERLAEWLPWAAGSSLELTQAFIRQTRQSYADQTGLTVLIVRDGAIAGCGGFNRIEWAHRQAVIGFWLGAGAEGEGTMTAFVAALCDHGFRELGLHRLELRAGVGNARSRAVAERSGFRLEGEARDCELVGGRWVSHAVYARLAIDGDRGSAGGP